MPKVSILLVNKHYWPDVASTGQHLTDLAEHLVGAGLDVTVLCGRDDYRGGILNAPSFESRSGVEIHRLSGAGFGRSQLAGRAVDYSVFHGRCAARLVWARRYDLVVSLTTPSLLPATVGAACSLRGIPYGIWAMDLHPEIEERLGFLKGGRPVTSALHAIARRGYQGARFVVALGEEMAEQIRRLKGVHPSRIATIPVWSDHCEVYPVRASENSLRKELGYDSGDFVVMYSGNAGHAHKFEEVLGAATRLRDRSDIHFVFVGDGPKRRQVESSAAQRSLPRFRYLNYFSRDQLARSLSVGDLHLLTLRTDMTGLVAPGKLYGIMAAGRPTLMVGSQSSDPARVITEYDVGSVVTPGQDSVDRVASAIREYADNERRREVEGLRARQVFLEHFERTVCCKAWEVLLRRALAGRGLSEGSPL